MMPTDYEKVDNQDIEKMKHNNKKLSVKIINPTNGQIDYIFASVYEEHKQYFRVLIIIFTSYLL
jgi:hypothetical protein